MPISPYQVLLTLLLLLLNARASFAQEETNAAVDRPPLTQRKSIKGFIPSPVLYYTPDTHLGFGASAISYFRLRSKIDTSFTRLSLVRLHLDYTLNRQTDQWLEWGLFTREEHYLLRGEMRHRSYHDRFYGIGNDTPDEDEERYRYKFIGGKLAFLRNIGLRTFLGPDVHIRKYYSVMLDARNSVGGSQLWQQQLPGYIPGFNNGLGAVLIIDHRNSTAFPSSGFYLELSGYRFGSFLGGDYNYQNLNFEINRYFGLKPKHVIATNTILNLNSGDVPVMHLASAGGDQILRGYAHYRFLADNFAGTQVEYRFPLFWRFSMVAFTGIGDVFQRPADLSLEKLKYSIGAGFRYAVAPGQSLNSRLDIGYGSEGFNVYLMVGEAF